MRYVAGCLCSAVAASLFTAWLVLPDPSSEAIAQGPKLPSLRVPDSSRGPILETAQYFNSDGLTPEEAVNVAVYDKLHKSVVNITTRSTRSDSLFLFESLSEGTGSGSVIDQAGHILTNWHVVADARNIGVTMFNGETYEAKVVGFDPPNDIAIIR
ncbi:MAG: S1C family serine protease, partial [Planctomycetaceae bacterium]